MILLVVIWSILVGYSVEWTGFGDFTTPSGEFIRGKTIWDWFELLIIPLSLLIGGYLLNRSERALERKIADERIKEDRKIAEDRTKLERELAIDGQQESALQIYLDRMSDLLIHEGLQTRNEESTRNVARTYTLNVLRRLDGNRKGQILQFLYEANLISTTNAVVDLHDANLINANLMFAELPHANLEHTNLTSANLEHANLSDANLEHAYLRKADLKLANLNRANLMHAELSDADLRGADLEGALLGNCNLRNANLDGVDFSGAIMPDGTIHE